jgi:hypothetical protein
MRANFQGNNAGAVPATLGQLVASLKRYFVRPQMVPYSSLVTMAPTGTTIVLDGRGWLAPGISVAQNTAKTITYNFGRVPIFVRLLDNSASAQTRLQVTARSATSVTIVPLDAALSDALIEIR